LLFYIPLICALGGMKDLDLPGTWTGKLGFRRIAGVTRWWSVKKSVGNIFH